MADNTLTIKFDKETTLPLLDGLGKSAYAIAVAHGFQGTEQEWLNSLRGPEGPKGPQGPDGPQGKEGKRGPKGEPGSAETAAQLLRQKNIYLPDSNVNTVIAKIVEVLGDKIKFTPKQIEYEQPNAGQTFIDLRGEPHFKVSINGGEKHEFESDNMRVNIEPFGADNILIKYFDLANREYQNIVIKGIAGATPEETYEDGSGAVWKKYGKKLYWMQATILAKR